MALFDATIADYFVFLLKTDFFGFVKKIELDKSYKLKDISKFASTEELMDSFIADIAESKKIYSMLKILSEYKPDLFVIDGEDIKNPIFEMIGRRNIHIHKKGIVDQTYLSQSDGNPYQLRIGDYATITSQYFTECYKTINSFVNNLE